MDASIYSHSRTRAIRRGPWLVRVLMLGVAALFASSVHSATQGSLGPDSSGSVDITYVQGINVRINGFEDMALGTWSGSGPMTAQDNLCIGRSGGGLFGAGVSYRILARGDGEPGDPAAFTLTNGAHRIYYRAFFNDQGGTAGRQELTAGAALTGQNSFGLWYFFNMIFNCAVENANISIEVPQSELSRASGAYLGTLSLMLAPE